MSKKNKTPLNRCSVAIPFLTLSHEKVYSSLPLLSGCLFQRGIYAIDLSIAPSIRKSIYLYFIHIDNLYFIHIGQYQKKYLFECANLYLSESA